MVCRMLDSFAIVLFHGLGAGVQLILPTYRRLAISLPSTACLKESQLLSKEPIQ
jgi:hypothetical protein